MNDPEITDDVKGKLKKALSRQDIFGRVRSVEKASVSMRFRVLVEVKPQANILNQNQYPEILDDTLNFVSPFYSEDEKENLVLNMKSVMGQKLKTFEVKHPFNGHFLVFQTSL